MANLKVQFKFRKNDEMHQRAQHYLETLDRGTFPDLGDAMATIIVDYFERQEESQEDVESMEEVLETSIENAVEKVLERKLPAMLDEAFENHLQALERSVTRETADDVTEEVEVEDNTVDLSEVADSISWGFLNG